MVQLNGSLLNLVGLSTSILAVIITLIILIVILVRGRKFWDIHLLLATNTYISVLSCSCLMVSLNMTTLLGDLKIYIEIDSTFCQVRGYMILFLYHWLFLTFALQAIGRMVNVLYGNTHFLLRSHSTAVLLMIAALLLALCLIGPHLVIQSVAYAPEEFLCVINFRMWQNYVYMLPTMYLGPIIIVMISYVRVIVAIHRSSVRLSKARHRTIFRDMLILQRTIILVIVLIILGFPTLIIWLLWLITGELHYLAYRVQIVTLSASIFILSITLTLINPQLKFFFSISRHKSDFHVMELIQRRHT